VVVTNTSAEPVTLTSLTDNVYGNLNGQGTCATGGTIAANGGTYTCSFQGMVSGEPGPHTDIVTATAVDNDGTSDTKSDDATVTLTNVPPAINVIKTANPTVVPETGGDVTFTFVVQNTSAAEAVTITSLSDDVYGTLTGDADCLVGTVLAVGASCEFSITRTVTGTYGGPDHVNVFTAKARDNDNTEVTASDDATVTFTRVLSALVVTKTVNWNGVTPDTAQTFQICIAGPTYPNGNCQTADYDGAVLTWGGLAPGQYTVTETDPGSSWTVSITGSPATVTTETTATATVTNTRKLGSLRITKVVDWGNLVHETPEAFEICIMGASYPTGTEPGACQTTNLFTTNGQQALVWSNLIPGAYTFSETTPDKPNYLWVTSYDPAGQSLTVPSDGGEAAGTVVNFSPTIPPTAVTLMYFKAEQSGALQVRLSWATAIETNNIGFNIYRASVNDPGQKQLVAQVRSQGGSGPYTYTITNDVPSAGAWYYWLADVDANTGVNPELVMAKADVLLLKFKTFLPGLSR
jgi:hypothetical protein